MIRVIALLLLLWVSLTQITLTPNQTLHKLADSLSNKSTLYSKAVSFLVKIHPELSNYTITSMTQSLNRGDQSYADNLFDFHFQLTAPSRRVLAIVTVSNTTDEEFVSISPFVLVTNTSSTTPLGNFWVSQIVPVSTAPTDPSPITNKAVSSTSLSDLMKTSSTKGGTPGGYYAYNDFNDALIQFALDFVAGQHPNMVNYVLKEAYYQVVSGINIRLHYTGTDNYTKVAVVVNFDLKKRPQIISFSVLCAPSYEYCTSQAAEDYFYAVEGMIVKHPELLAYRVVSVYAEQNASTSTLKVLITFQNSEQQLRTMTQLDVQKNQSSVQSFFTYSQAS